MRLGMVVDTKRCTGCHTCSVACKVANNLPNHIWWNRVVAVGPEGTFPDNTKHFLTVNCQHCENPPCVAVCPVGATFRRASDGVIIQNSETCIGCRRCIPVCPFDARSLNDQQLEYYLDHAVGDADAPVHRPNVVEKCTFCSHRLARGEKPACMELCIGRGRFWGDLDDPRSEVSIAMRGRESFRLHEETGVRPKVYFLK